MPWRWLLGRGWQHQVFQRDRVNIPKQTSCPVQNVFWKKPEIVASPMQHHHCIRPCSQDFASAVPAELWKWNGHKKIWAKMAGLSCLMLLLFPENLNPKVLGTPRRNCSDASPTSMLWEAWRSKKCNSFKRPWHSSGRLWVEGLSTFAPRQHRGPGCRCRSNRCHPYRRRCTSHRQLRSIRPCGLRGLSAPSRWRWLLTTSPPAGVRNRLRNQSVKRLFPEDKT